MIEEKLQKSKRIERDLRAQKRQQSILKAYGEPVKSAGHYTKRHALNCGKSGCTLCANPRRVSKDRLTVQEKKALQESKLNQPNGDPKNEI